MSERNSNIPGLLVAFSASCTTGGSIYAFGIYGDALKKALSLTQLQLDSISATFFIAGLFTWMPGLVVDRLGTRFSMILGGCSGAFHTLLYWAVARQFFPISRVVALLSFLAVAICLSCGLIIGSIFKLTLVCGGPKYKGSAVGIAKGLVGLGAGVYATIFQALRTPEESALDFIPVIAVFFLVCAVFPAWLFLLPKGQMGPNKVEIRTTVTHFRIMYGSLFLMACFILWSSISDIMVQEDDSSDAVESKHDRDYGKVIALLLIWLGPIWSLLYLPKNPSEELIPLVAHGQPETSSSEEDSKHYDPVEEQQVTTAKEEKKPRKDLNLMEMLQTVSAWLMLWTTIILVGSGTAKTNNMGEMVESLGFPEAVNPATLAIFSVSQAVARIVTGVTSEAALRWKLPLLGFPEGVPRPFFLAIASTICFLSHVWLAFVTTQIHFVIACTISGLSFGMAWPLMVLIVGDVYGTTHAGANYMMYDGSTKALGTIFLSQYVAANVYQRHVDEDIDKYTCYGLYCFQETHLAIAALALTGVAASFGLMYTTRNTYANRH